MVLDGLAGDVQPVARSRGSTARRRAAGGPRPPASSARRLPSGRCGPARRATAAARRQRRRAVLPRAARSPPVPPSPRRRRPPVQRSGERARHLQARACELHRQLCPREALQCLVQAGARVSAPAGDADLPLGERGGGSAGTAPRCASAMRPRRSRGPRGVVDVPSREVDVDEQREQRAHHGRRADRRDLVVRAFGGPLQQVPRERRVAAGQVEGGERADGVGMRSSPCRSWAASSRRPWRTRRSARRMSAASRRRRACPGRSAARPRGARSPPPSSVRRRSGCRRSGHGRRRRRRCSAACGRRRRASTGRRAGRR